MEVEETYDSWRLGREVYDNVSASVVGGTVKVQSPKFSQVSKPELTVKEYWNDVTTTTMEKLVRERPLQEKQIL